MLNTVSHPPRRKLKAFTLITALAFTLIVGTVLAGVGTVSFSHYGRSKVEGDYANAVSLADAGVNYELTWISRDITDPTRASQAGSPHVGSVPGINGTYSVYVQAWGTGCNGGNWAAPADMCIKSTGIINGVSRTVEVRGTRKSVFDDYAIYAFSFSNSAATFNGTGASAKDGIEGNMGTNGGVTFHGSEGSDAVDGTLSLNGSTASSSSNLSNVQANPDAVMFPTVSQVAQAMFPGGGLSWLQTHNANASVMMLKSTDPSLASEPTTAGFTLADVNSKLTTAGFTSASRSFGSAPIKVTNDSSALDNPGGSRFAMPADPTYGAQAIGVNGTPVYFFPPGDYYLSDLNFINKGSWVMLTHLGQIRLWVDSNSTSGDTISKLNIIFTDPTASKFRLYYNKCATITMHGQGLFRGSVYAIKSGCANGPGLDLSGGNEIYGSVIANNFTIGGGSFVVFPNNGGNDDSSDAALWYGFKDNWKEVNPTGNPVFVDGTSK
jgi:hypothetical protein